MIALMCFENIISFKVENIYFYLWISASITLSPKWFHCSSWLMSDDSKKKPNTVATKTYLAAEQKISKAVWKKMRHKKALM